MPKRHRLWLHDRRALRLLVIAGGFTRECLAIDVARRLTSDNVLERHVWLMATRVLPDHIRSDNGPEFTQRWCGRGWGRSASRRSSSCGFATGERDLESFHGKLRGALLNRQCFDTLLEARVLIER